MAAPESGAGTSSDTRGEKEKEKPREEMLDHPSFPRPSIPWRSGTGGGGGATGTLSHEDIVAGREDPEGRGHPLLLRGGELALMR